MSACVSTSMFIYTFVCGFVFKCELIYVFVCRYKCIIYCICIYDISILYENDFKKSRTIIISNANSLFYFFHLLLLL